MNNEQFLIVSYFTVGALVLAISLAAHSCLRRPLAGIVRTFRNRHLGPILKRTSPFALALPALAGFLSVDYYSCKGSYSDIIADRSYLVEKNQEQISTACLYLIIAILIWGAVLLITLAKQREKEAAGAKAEQKAGSCSE